MMCFLSVFYANNYINNYMTIFEIIYYILLFSIYPSLVFFFNRENLSIKKIVFFTALLCIIGFIFAKIIYGNYSVGFLICMGVCPAFGLLAFHKIRYGK